MSTRRERAKGPAAALNKQLAEMEAERKRIAFERSIALWKSEMATDLAKLVFGGVVIGGIYQSDVDFRNIWQIDYKRGIKE